MKLHVIVSDFGAAAHMSANTEVKARAFDLPAEIADYIRASRTDWSTISLAFEDESKEPRHD